MARQISLRALLGAGFSVFPGTPPHYREVLQEAPGYSFVPDHD